MQCIISAIAHACQFKCIHCLPLPNRPSSRIPSRVPLSRDALSYLRPLISWNQARAGSFGFGFEEEEEYLYDNDNDNDNNNNDDNDASESVEWQMHVSNTMTMSQHNDGNDTNRTIVSNPRSSPSLLTLRKLGFTYCIYLLRRLHVPMNHLIVYLNDNYRESIHVVVKTITKRIKPSYRQCQESLMYQTWMYPLGRFLITPIH